jgi:Stress responsive A/B Barrel Domain
VFRHVVMFAFKDGTTEVQKEALAAALHQLPELIPEIRSYCFGRDLGLRDDNYDFVLTADFDDADGFLVYSDHPDHLNAIAEFAAPIAKTRAAVQFEWPTDLPGSHSRMA